jgi:hypothetical protein
MPTVLQFRRGTTTQNNSFTGTAGELSVDTTLDTLRIHDGSTAGGFALLKETGISNLTLNAQAEIRLGDSDSSNYVGFKSPGTVASNLIFTLPSADGTSGQALVTDASGNLSFAAAGATVSQDNSTDTAFNIYFASTTSGALTAVKYDGSDMTFNPSTSTFVVTNSSTTASIAKYADLAENYTSDTDYEPGTVVELGGSEEVTQTKRPTSNSIAGIVSTNPGYLMNGALENGLSVALLGRVPCKVVGTINKGDILVSSSTPGHAEAHRDLHSPPAGSMIGKAIESKTGDEPGIIEVLVGRL